MDILKEQLNRSKELMGILNEQETPEKDRCVDLWYKWSNMVDQLIKRKTNSVGDEELEEAKQVCSCMNKYDEFQRNRFTEKIKNVLTNLGLGECIKDSIELEEIVVYDETQEEVDGEGIQGLYEGNELNDTDLSNVSENEDDWVKGSWDELDSEIKNIYKKTEEFKGCLEDGDDVVNEQSRENY